jgi:8-oxo-dGTP pyrophosphatase MutT (NUDIX family)
MKTVQKTEDKWNKKDLIVCLNCEKYGHYHYQCKIPILSVGIIAFNISKENEIKYLMIRRRHTLGFMDFIRGKYSIYNKNYLINLFVQMTVDEKEYILTKDFSELWNYLWNKNVVDYHSEFLNSKEKFMVLKYGIINNTESYSLQTLIESLTSSSQWTEPEWGFPKGRKNYNEKDLDGALREFSEETGYSSKFLKIVENILPFEEVFMGSNYKTYKHCYYLMKWNYLLENENSNYDTSEVSKVEWKTYEEAIASIRPYNLEKIRMLNHVNSCFTPICMETVENSGMTENWCKKLKLVCNK